MNKLNLSAKWIWTDNNKTPDARVVFRKTLELDAILAECIAYLAVDTKYWLYINGKQVVFEGGLFRESLKGCGYADRVDLAPFLVPGKNIISVLCWFYGNGGRNNTDSTQAGFLMECPALGLQSDSSFRCCTHPAFYKTNGLQPAFLYGGHNTGFDANRDFGDFTACDFDDSAWQPATEYPNEVWGDLYERPIPLHKISEKKSFSGVTYENGKYLARLPYAAQVTVGFEVEASGGEVIEFCTDRYCVNGGPGDNIHLYRGHRTEYICKPGLNRFESLFYFYGETVIFSCDKPVLFREFFYRESGYNCEIVGEFTCDSEIINRSVEKAIRTLYVCMRDNFMDCPDRERGQWIGDVSVQLPQVGFVLDSNALLLAKKCIGDFIHLRDGDILRGNVPGQNSSELPSQSLNAIGSLGMIATYYRYTRDKSVLELCFEPCIRYLKLWELDENGLVRCRKGNWPWIDHLHNIDAPVCENAWYYMALEFMQFMAKELADHRFDKFIEMRRASLKENFEKTFWNGHCFASSDFVDDRANALAVLASLCGPEKYEAMRYILLTTFNSTVYMENYVLLALCRMGYVEDAYHRMVSRYTNLALNENSTLWEDFFILGSRNHAWTGAPITIAYQYFMGIDTNDGFETMTVTPNKTLFKKMSCTVNGKDGLIHMKVDNVAGRVTVINGSKTRVTVQY